MAISVRQADLHADRAALTHLIKTNLDPDAGGGRFDWLYFQNPAGEGRVWVAEEDKESIGMAAAFPREVVISGETVRAWIMGDFCLAPRYRTVGPALALQRQCLADLGRDEECCWYDFPSRTMTAVYGRLGIHPAGSIVRMAMPLRVDHKLGTAGRILKAPLNAALRLRQPKGDHDVSVSDVRSELGKDFDEVVNGSSATCYGKRSAKYLAWRYQRHPLRKFDILRADTDGRLAAYCVLSDDGRDIWIDDYFGSNAPNVVATLMSSVARIGRDRNRFNMNVSVLVGTELLRLLKQLGFVERESVPVLINRGSKTDASTWFLMNGDRES